MLFLRFLLSFTFFTKIYQTLKTLFDHISNHLEVCQKYSAVRRIFKSLLGVWKCGQTWSFMFDILHQNVQLTRTTVPERH